MNNNKKILQKELDKISQQGIQADRKHLKRNMHTQFADPFEFAREYVVNSYDAMATECYISGRREIIDNEQTITIIFRDNGTGMNEERVMDFFKIFRSRKDHAKVDAIGKFGVGKLSVAALPGLIKYAGTTSTGKECWHFETDSLIEDREIILKKINPVPPQGTRFEITLKIEKSLSKVLEKIYFILEKYINHLDINVYFDLPETDEQMNPIRRKLTHGIWHYNADALGKAYTIKYDNKPIEIIMGIGNTEHKLYQNKVYITSKYNLVSYGEKTEYKIPNLMIRANSEIFELTFGRHCLSNEKVLHAISDKIRTKILPDYFDFLCSRYNENLLMHNSEAASKIDEMVIGLLAYFPNEISWNSFPVFNVFGGKRVTFGQILQEATVNDVVYLEARKSEGTDYSHFDSTVLLLDQPYGAIKLLQNALNNKLVDLGNDDGVIEASNCTELKINDKEKDFERHLVFNAQKDILNEMIAGIIARTNDNNVIQNIHFDNLRNQNQLKEELDIASSDLNDIIWKVNYLVERDGITPCRTRKYLVNYPKIVLNLFHPEIQDFIALSTTNSELAAHWAMAMCISDPKLLSHIALDFREELILIDALNRLNTNKAISNRPNLNEEKAEMISFLRNCNKRY